MAWTKDNDGPFINQQYVDDIVLETEDLVANIDDEETAIKAFKKIQYLNYVSKSYFVPDIVMSWEEVVLSYIKSPKAVFECVHYPHIQKTHKEGFETFKSLEEYALNGKLVEEKLFIMIDSFNRGIVHFNTYCEEYGKLSFPIYTIHSKILKQHYVKWRQEISA